MVPYTVRSGELAKFTSPIVSWVVARCVFLQSLFTFVNFIAFLIWTFKCFWFSLSWLLLSDCVFLRCSLFLWPLFSGLGFFWIQRFSAWSAGIFVSHRSRGHFRGNTAASLWAATRLSRGNCGGICKVVVDVYSIHVAKDGLRSPQIGDGAAGFDRIWRFRSARPPRVCVYFLCKIKSRHGIFNNMLFALFSFTYNEPIGDPFATQDSWPWKRRIRR